MSMDKIVVFETFYNPMEANIVKARLLDAGIQCFLSDENTIVINPLYTQALGGIKLHLFENDVPFAKNILSEAHEGQLEEHTAVVEEGAILCPNCGSAEVGYVQATKKRFGFFTMLVSFLLMVYPFHAKKVHHCFHCRHEF